jgi:hypothetical protein
MCALLVELKIVKKITVNFLPVGHTHEDVDQMFSRISEHLKRVGADSLTGLHSTIEEAYTPKIQVCNVPWVHDIKDWLKPNMEDLHGHSTPLSFKFTSNGQKAVMRFRHWCSEPWSEETLVILKSLPNATPKLVTRSYEKQDMVKFEECLVTWKDWLSEDAYKQWCEFVTQANENPPVDALETYWPLNNITGIYQADKEGSCDSQPRRISERDVSLAQVYIGPYRSKQVEVHTVRELSGLNEGQLVAIHCEEGTEPAIARLTAVNEDTVDVVWFKGGYSTAWTPFILYEGKRKVEWKDKLPKSSIILYDFELTKTKHLHKATITHLKKKYEQLRTDKL